MKLLMKSGLDISGGESCDDGKYPLIIVIPGVMALNALLWWVVISLVSWAIT